MSAPEMLLTGTASELIRRLKMVSPNAIVRAWDPDAETYLPITGLLVRDHVSIEVQTDGND